LVLFFFFSSRRRHTRSKRDWSSDVCSSDLNFQYLTNDKPEDYSDVNVWMEEEKVEIKDNYYDVTMKSNLNELTRINASIVVNNNEHSGFTSNTTVGPDGSFRFRI